MIGKRLEKARQIAKKHQKRANYWHPRDDEYPVHYMIGRDEVTREEWEEHQRGLFRKTRCFCSTCCGNPRHFYGNKFDGLTMQEKKREQKARPQAGTDEDEL